MIKNRRKKQKRMSFLSNLLKCKLDDRPYAITVDNKDFYVRNATGSEVLSSVNLDVADYCIYFLSRCVFEEITDKEPIGEEKAKKFLDLDYQLAYGVVQRIIDMTKAFSDLDGKERV